METHNQTGHTTQKKMLLPQPATFQDREDLVKYVRDFGANQGYVVTIKKSRKDRRVILGCDRGGVYRNRRKIDESKRKRKASSRLINCPFEAIGKKEDDLWVLTIKNEEHNHEPLKDMSEHPYSRRFTEEEVRKIKVMTEAGVKPRQVLKALKQCNPKLQSTPRHLYNLKAKIRQGNLSEKFFASWRPNRAISVNASANPNGDIANENNQPVPNFIGGKYMDSQSCSSVDVIDPATQEVVSQVPLSTYDEFKAAVNAAKKAFLLWKNAPVTSRQQIMFKLQELIRRDIDKLAINIAIEQGQTRKGAQRDVLHSLEVIEHSCRLAALQMGEFIPNMPNGMDTYSIREPLGVCAGICPFNFASVVSLWMFPIAVTCGNTFILKACEKNPGVSMILAALAMEAGLPDGVLNVVHGTNDVLDYICDDEDIKAISFVGSDTFGMQMYAKAAARGKRIQSNIGSKNYAIIMPDASMDASLNAVASIGFGQMGMSLDTVVFIGGSIQWEEELVLRVKSLKVNVGTDPTADIGPVITEEVKDHVCRLVQSAVQSGARLLLDGRYVMVPGYESGNFIGPTILSDVTTNMDCYKCIFIGQEEIFGPVLLCMQAESLEEAITIVNRNNHGTGASIFTTSGISARKFQNEVEAGMVGINVPVPLPLSSLNGKAGLEFYTQIKTVAQRWNDLPTLGVPLAMPSSSETSVRSLGLSSALPSTSGRDSPHPRISPSMPSPSETNSLNQIPPPLSSRVASQQSKRNSIPLTSERIYHVKTSNRTDQAMAMANEGYIPASHDISPITLGIDSIHRNSERVYMLATSHLTENLCLTFQRTDPTLFSTSGPTIHRPDQMGSRSLSTDVSLQSTADRIFLSERNDNVRPDSQHGDNVIACSASEKMYMPSGVHRNSGGPATSEWLCIPSPATSQIMYCQGAMITGDDFTSQGLPLSLPTSQRI